MTEQKPTDKQIKKFWAWCGFRLEADIDFFWWYLPDGGHLPLGEQPALDLNNLFKYAVPKLDELGYAFELYRWHEVDWKNAGYGARVYRYTPIVPQPTIMGDPALALFWAIWGVID